MEKFNIAELLKDCPKGMELDCMMCDNLSYDYIDKEQNRIYCKVDLRDTVWFTVNGCVNLSPSAKCVIFPKGKTTWEGFVPPCKFKDGDILATEHGIFIGIVKVKNNMQVNAYCSINSSGCFEINSTYGFERLATEEEKEKLFNIIKANGYKWNPETKTLEKLVQPKFKVGDVIINIYRKHLNCDSKGGKISQIIDDKYIFDNGSYTHIQFQDDYELVSNKAVEAKFKVGDRIVQKNGVCVPILISNVGDEFYYTNTESSVGVLPISKQDDWELAPNKFDISTLIPFESKVLVRDDNKQKWGANFWGFYDNSLPMNFPFSCCGTSYAQCIPYEGNEHLLGRKDDCDDYYKTWE